MRVIAGGGAVPSDPRQMSLCPILRRKIQMKSKSVTGSSPKKPKVVLVLQGGGALGAYHIGAYQALEEAGFRPDWV
jgi:hypothetical protein